MKIMEVTLRDGSYAIDFQFTAIDTGVIGYVLEQSGFEFIEVGHGVGLHASESGYGEAADTDEAYLKAAAENITRAKFGMFCIPGIARLEDIDMAAEHGMGFIRIGTNVTEVEKSAPFIVRAREHGMMVTANFMKSYALEPHKFAEKVLLSKSFGSEVIYLVDSSGGMLPQDIELYMRAVRDACDIPMGFHGHDNLGMAIANSMRAVEMGAELVDSSLQGMGRSAGNAATEMLVVVMEKMGIKTGIDKIAAMDAGEKYIRPLIRRKGVSSLDVIAGGSQFHSSYMGIIRKYSLRYQVDPRRLIERLCEVDKINASPELVEDLAINLQSERAEVFTARFEFDDYFGKEQDANRHGMK
ncbi:MAG: 4-hydroxy-2-oxopentanoic acid aldolase [Lentisphaerae bacterium GWF2_57_35]|nr:MAG: 4-hydroxy-2-oxopentanoic acid aldolase [Lentisphaerae bacterium GWF2_57_35]